LVGWVLRRKETTLHVLVLLRFQKPPLAVFAQGSLLGVWSRLGVWRELPVVLRGLGVLFVQHLEASLLVGVLVKASLLIPRGLGILLVLHRKETVLCGLVLRRFGVLEAGLLGVWGELRVVLQSLGVLLVLHLQKTPLPVLAGESLLGV